MTEPGTDRRARTEAGRPPWWAWLPAGLGAAFVGIPLLALGTQVGWTDLPALVTSPASLDALGLSLRTSLASTALCLVLGVPLALVLARATWRGARALRSLVLLPLVLPPVVSGLALLLTLGRHGLLGAHLEALGVRVGFTTVAVVLAQAFVSLPFLVVSLEGALRAAGTRHEAVAATLGASPTQVLRRVTLPLVLPGLLSGAVLAFARSLGEFGATLTFAGSLQGVTRTLPLEVYLQRETDPAAAVALSLVLVVVAAVVVGGVHGGGGSRGRAPAPDAEPVAASAGPRPAGSIARGRPSRPDALQVRASLADRRWAVDLRRDGSGVTAVIGPNGSGKSTLLQVVAGLLRPTDVSVRHGDRVLADSVTGAWVPAHRRRVTLLGQEPLVLPHLDVRDNVALGLRVRGVPRAEARHTAQAWLDHLGVGHLARRRGDHLSGGQAQRVALARALATEPDVLLLDEPFAALDVDVAAEMRHQLRDLLHERPTRVLLVTHDPLDVAGLAHDVLVLDDGHVVEDGTADEVLASPRTPFAAAFVGRDLVRGTAVAPDVVELADGTRVHGRGVLVPGEPAVALWDPADVAVHVGEVSGSPRTVIRGTVAEVTTHRGAVRLTVRTPSGVRVGADVTPLAVAELDLRPGRHVALAVKAQSIALLPAP